MGNLGKRDCLLKEEGEGFGFMGKGAFTGFSYRASSKGGCRLCGVFCTAGWRAGSPSQSLLSILSPPVLTSFIPPQPPSNRNTPPYSPHNSLKQSLHQKVTGVLASCTVGKRFFFYWKGGGLRRGTDERAWWKRNREVGCGDGFLFYC